MSSVDVVVPCYRYGHFLRECVESVLSQQGVDVRVLIIDDASPDNTAEVAAALAREDPRVTFRRHPANKGHIATYNEGIKWAAADYFLLLSADDLLFSDALERAVRLMDENPDIVLVHGKYIQWDDKFPLPEMDHQNAHMWRRQDLIHEMCVGGTCLVCTPTAVTRTSAQKAVGGYRPSLPHSGDMEMWLRLAAHGTVARIEEPVQAIYRQHSSNMSTYYYEQKLRDFKERKKVFDIFFAEHRDMVPQAQKLMDQANKTLSGLVYISGIARLCRGRINSGLQFLRYSMHLNPTLCLLPPVALAFECAISALRKRVARQ